MTLQQTLAALREKTEHVTKLPWSVDRDGDIVTKKAGTVTQNAVRCITEDGELQGIDDRDFIVTAANSYEPLLDVIEKLAAALSIIQSQSVDELPPFRYAPADVLAKKAHEALTSVTEMLEKLK